MKMQAEPSGKEKIKAGAPADPKDSIKEGTEVVEPTKESAPAEQPKEEAKTEAPATTPAEQPKEEAKTAAPASTPAEQPKEEAKTAAPASTPAEQPKEEAKTAAPASTPAEQPKEEAKTAAPVEKEMVEELRKPENLIQDFDAPADSAKGGNAVPVTPGSGTAADGKPK